MSFRLTATAIVGGLLVSACGGGGGSGGTGGAQVGAAVQLVAVNESSAKPLAANALDNVLKASATRATGLPIGVGALQAMAAAGRLGASVLTTSPLPQGVDIQQSIACPAGGSITVTGSVANTAAISAGDTLTVTHNNCRTNQAGVLLTFNGEVAIKIVSGVVTDSLPFHVVMDTTATNLSVQGGSSLVVSNGDARIDWNVTSATSQSLLATGSALNTRETVAGVTRNNALRDYTQSLGVVGPVLTGTLAGTIETDSPQIAPKSSTYNISTPAAVVWNAVTGVVGAGTIKVVGANDAQFTLTFTSNNNAQILLDSNGDGVVDQTITTNLTELGGLL